MRKLLLSLLFLFLITIGIRLPVFANHIPQPTGHINDFAGLLTPDQKTQLEESLSNYQQQTGNEIAVAIIKTIGDDTIENFAVKTFEEWNIGKKGKDNGLLFLVATNDHKVRIEVGYGLEPYITDGQAGEIVRNIIAPQFKQGNYYQGIADGIAAIEARISGKSVDTKPNGSGQSIFDYGEIILIALVFLAQFVMYLFAFLARSKSIWAGGIIGGIIGLLLGLFVISFLAGVISAVILGLMGFLLDYILSRNYSKLSHLGKQTNWWGSRGGFYGGGRSWGRSSGFGGFGGGSSGGGGASGRW